MSHTSVQPASADLATGGPSAARGAVGTSPRWISIAAWVFVALGIVMQVWHFAGARPLWLDEAMLALNIRHLSPTELMGKLDYDQIAPLGWLQLEKLLLGLPVAPEYSLRLPSLLAGVGALVLFRDLAFRTLSPLGALGGVVLFAFSQSVVRYAVEVKPYETDLFFALAVLALGVILAQRRERWIAGLLGLGVLGLVAIPFSFPVVFVLAGVGGVLFIRRLFQGRRGEAAILAAIGIAWVGLFAGLMLGLYESQTADTVVRQAGAEGFFERTAYAPLPPTSLGDMAWFAKWGDSLLQFFHSKEGRMPLAAAMAVGFFHLWRRAPWVAAMVCAPVAAGLLASGLEAYPFYDRLALFVLPGFLLIAAGGLDWIAEKSRPALLPWAMITGLVAAGGLPDLQGNLRRDPPYDIQNIRPVMETLRREAKPGDAIYVSNQAIPAWLFYKDAYGLSGMKWVAGKEFIQWWSCLWPEFPTPAPGGRTWVMSLVVGFPTPPSDEALTPMLAMRGLTGEVKLRAEGQNVWLWSVQTRPRPEGGLAGAAPPPKECGQPRPNAFDPPARIARRAG